MKSKNIKLKKKNLLFGIAAALILIPIVLAVTGVIQTDTFYDSSTSEGLTNVQSILFKCNDSNCDSIGSQILNLSSGASNTITFEYPYNPSSTESNRDYYAHYIFAQCYLPKEYVESIWGYGANLNYDYNFNKAASCHSPIDSFSVTNSNYVNEPVVVNVLANLEADAHSAFTNLLLSFVPSGFEDYYSAETKITLEILNSAGNVVHTESQTFEILQDTSQNVQFTWTPSTQGDYTARVKTEITDCQCQSSFEQNSQREFKVWAERPQNACYTIINDLEAVPEFAQEDETVNVNFNKISNYADNSFAKTPVETRVKYEITDSNNNVVFTNNSLLSANPNSNDTKNIAFSWVPDFGGNFNIKVTGVAENSLCDGKTNPEDTAILGFFVKSAETFAVTFVVSDSETGNLLEGVSVDFGTQSGETNSAGKVVFTSNPGTFDWEVSLNDYETKTGSETISGNATINVALVPIEENNGGNGGSDGGSSTTTHRSTGAMNLNLPSPLPTIQNINYETPQGITPGEKTNWKNVLFWFFIAEMVMVIAILLVMFKRRF